MIQPFQKGAIEKLLLLKNCSPPPKECLQIPAHELTKEFGSNYSGRSLRYYRKFYLCFPDFEIWNTRVPNLNWSHFRALLRVPDEDARVWYMNEAANENWSVRTLDRNIGTQYYYRLLHSPKKEAVMAEMKEKAAAEPKHQFELLKSPIVAEFLGFRTEDSFAESDLESAILSHIRDFLIQIKFSSSTLKFMVKPPFRVACCGPLPFSG